MIILFHVGIDTLSSIIYWKSFNKEYEVKNSTENQFTVNSLFAYKNDCYHKNKMSTVLGIGVGLFSLIIIWILCIFLCFILSRSGKQAGVFGVGVLLVLVTLVMALYPRKEENEVDTEQNNDYVDTMAIPRIIYAVFVTLFLLVGLVAFLLDHVLMPNIAVAAKTKKTYTF